MNEAFGIILKVPYEKTGSTAGIEILGKSMLEWVAVSLDGAPYAAADFNDSMPLPALLRPYVSREYPVTVVLYSDTPLISKKTVADAVASLMQSSYNVLKLTRGYVFRTEYLLSCDNIYTEQTFYFGEEDFVTAFNFRQISLITDILKTRILTYHMEQGVQFEDAATAYVGGDVHIGSGVVVGPSVTLKGRTIIKDNVRIKAGCIIEDSIIDEGAAVNSSQIYSSYVGAGTKVGPYAYIRPESVIGPGCRIGDFVEIKKSVIGEGCKISHLSYVGDCEMGEACNVGCGVVFVNYDGKNKFRTKVGNRVFVGSNSNIVAPVVLADGAFVAAGSTLTADVPENSLAIARARQVNKPGWQGNNFTKKS